MAQYRIEHVLRDFRVGREAFRAMRHSFVEQNLRKPREDIALKNSELVVAVFREALFLRLLDRKRALILICAVAVKHPHLDDCSGYSRWNPQAGVAHVGGL